MSTGVQNIFFDNIRKGLPPNISLAEAIAAVLKISTDSAYRRLRGEKILTIDELQLLAEHFKISVDQVMSLQSNTTSFTGNFINASNFSLEQYMQDMVNQLKLAKSYSSAEMIYFSKDVPVFHYLMFPELAAFKFFIWMKTLIPDEPVNWYDINLQQVMDGLIQKSQQLAQLYVSIPGIEILSPENTVTTQWQIEYYREANLFRSEKEIVLLYDKLDEMNDHMERQAEAGRKFLPGSKPTDSSAPYKLYINDFVIGDNTVIIKADENRFCFQNHNTINYYLTRDERFIEYTSSFLDNIIRKSILVSVVGEKERSMFFHHTRSHIDKFRQSFLKSAGTINY